MSGEHGNDYNQRLNHELEMIRNEIRRRETDSNLITLDNVEVRYVGPNGSSFHWSESLQAISEQVISALHMAPFMIGRNWGTTQTWGTAQYQLLTNNARSVQKAKCPAEWLRNLELILQGFSSKSYTTSLHHHIDSVDRACAFRTSASTFIELSEKG